MKKVFKGGVHSIIVLCSHISHFFLLSLLAVLFEKGSGQQKYSCLFQFYFLLQTNNIMLSFLPLATVFWRREPNHSRLPRLRVDTLCAYLVL